MHMSTGETLTPPRPTPNAPLARYHPPLSLVQVSQRRALPPFLHPWEGTYRWKALARSCCMFKLALLLSFISLIHFFFFFPLLPFLLFIFKFDKHSIEVGNMGGKTQFVYLSANWTMWRRNCDLLTRMGPIYKSSSSPYRTRQPSQCS